jgi:tetratricopeptide (TPR) repeat protein/transcriptional regulator with XRE-family HTH domain
MSDFTPNDTFREIRRKRWSRKQLALLLETTQADIAHWERGEAWPEPAMLQKLCTLFAMSLEELGFPERLLSQQKEESRYAHHAVHSAIYDAAIPLLPAVPLVGRTRELLQMKQCLRSETGGATILIALNGLPGVGKTTLAIALAYDHEVRTHFLDGILWAGLGPDPHLLNVLHRWGTLLGIAETSLEKLRDVSSWTTALRLAIGSRKMLLVIDDAWKIEDVLAFCIGGPNCTYLITTRFAHIATHSVISDAIHIQELSEEESVELLHLLAPRVVDAEPSKVRDLVRSVGGLPLALTLMGNYLRTQTANKLARRITATLERLSYSNERLHVYELHPSTEKHPGLPGGALLSLQSVIAISDQLLSSSARAALYALSIFPAKPHSFSEEAALAVASCTYEDLDSLSDAGIIESHSDRHMLHQVIADYARLQLQEQAEQEAIGRLIIYVSKFVEDNRKEYELLELESSTIYIALDIMGQSHKQRWAQLVSSTCAFMPFLITRGLYAQAESYLQRAYTVASGLDGYEGGDKEGRDGKSFPHTFIQLFCYLGEIAQKKGDLAQAERYFQRGLERATAMKHGEYICDLLKDLGWIADKQGKYEQACIYLQESLRRARQRVDRERLCGILSILGLVLAHKGEYEQAEICLIEGLSLARTIGDQQQLCSLLVNMGTLHILRGDFLRAEDHFQEGLFHARQLGHREWICTLLIHLGEIANEHDDYRLAEKYFHEVIEFVRELGLRELLCVSLINLATGARKQEKYVEAHAYLEESLALSRQIAQPHVGAYILYEYAELYFELDLIQEAKELFLSMGKVIPPGNRELLALAHYGLARTLAAQGNVSEARKVGNECAEVFETMRHRKAQEVRLWMEALR